MRGNLGEENLGEEKRNPKKIHDRLSRSFADLNKFFKKFENMDSQQ
jgi:hypothetical protein